MVPGWQLAGGAIGIVVVVVGIGGQRVVGIDWGRGLIERVGGCRMVGIGILHRTGYGNVDGALSFVVVVVGFVVVAIGVGRQRVHWGHCTGLCVDGPFFFVRAPEGLTIKRGVEKGECSTLGVVIVHDWICCFCVGDCGWRGRKNHFTVYVVLVIIPISVIVHGFPE